MGEPMDPPGRERQPPEQAVPAATGVPTRRIEVSVDGRKVAAIVDTASPDTLVLPRGTAPAGRRAAHVVVGGTDFGNVDVLFADVAQVRAGNRLLSKFLVAIDYGRRQVGLWRDPRTTL